MNFLKTPRPSQRPDLFDSIPLPASASPSEDSASPTPQKLAESSLHQFRSDAAGSVQKLRSMVSGTTRGQVPPKIGQKTAIGWRGYLLRFWLVFAVLWLTIYLGFRISYVNLNPALAVFSVLVCLAEMHILLHLYGMFYGLWPRRYETWEAINANQDLRCNVFICACGEPPEVIRETIVAALETTRVFNETIAPHFPARVIVLNDGKVAKKDNWRAIETICEELGAHHIARDIPGGFKAGNINNGLRHTATPDPRNTIDVVFDSDFCAKPEFLVEITKPLVDETIDFVQSPQRYKNETNWVAKAAAAHQIFFFDWICPAKGHDNALFLCGTNFAIRRSALDLVGGLDEKFITEDYATSLELHLAGCRGVFLPKVIALGMAPTSLKQYFTQQKRWSKGNFDVTGAYFKKLFFGPLTFKQKMHYMLSATYYLIGLRDLILMLAPIPYLFFGQSLIKPNSLAFLFIIYGPFLVANFAMYLRMFRFPIKSLVLDLVSFPVFTGALFSSLFKQKLGFVVTIKQYQRERPLDVYRPQLIICFLLFTGLIYSYISGNFNGFGSLINYWWATFNAVFLGLGFYLLVVENARWKDWEATGEIPQRDDGFSFGGLFISDRTAFRVGGALTLGLAAAAWFHGASKRPLEPYIPLAAVPAPMKTRGEVFGQVTVAPQNKVIALTFDDGPDPRFTPQILEILKAEKVPATFYLIGKSVEEHPRLARQINAAGHDIGNHSHSHHAKPVDPAAEVWRTNKIIEQIVGVTPTHFRPPMGLMNNGMAQQAMRQKQAVILWSADPKDWDNPSASEITARVMRDAKPGGIVLLHDGGGDRSPTIEALPKIIRNLRAKGYRFVTVPKLLVLHGRKK